MSVNAKACTELMSVYLPSLHYPGGERRKTLRNNRYLKVNNLYAMLHLEIFFYAKNVTFIPRGLTVV